MKEEGVNEEKLDWERLDEPRNAPEFDGETSNRSWGIAGGRMGIGIETCFPLSSELEMVPVCSSCSSDVKGAS